MISIRTILQESWNRTWDNIELLTGITIILLIGSFIWSLVQPLLLHPALFALSGILSFFVGWLVKIMYTKLFLDLLDHKNIGWNAQFPDGGLFIRYIVGSILFGLIVAAPIIVFGISLYSLGFTNAQSVLDAISKVTPFVIWVTTGLGVLLSLWIIVSSITFGFQRLLIVDKELGPIESLRKSRMITRGSRFRIFILVVMLGLTNLLGALLFFIGLLFTIPFSVFALTITYRELVSIYEGERMA